MTWLAAQVAFVEMPSFSLNLTLYGGDVSFLPGLEAYLSSFVKDSILRCCLFLHITCWNS